MPFDFEKFEAECRKASDGQLQQLYQKYVRQTTSGSTGTAVGIGLSFFTLGLSLIGSAACSATVANAAAKVDIIKTEMARRNKKNQLSTRARDIFGGIALGTTPLLTFGLVDATVTAAASGANFTHVHPPHAHFHLEKPFER